MDTSEAVRWPGRDPRQVDKLSRWVFPGLFALFVLTYWTAYSLLSASQARLQARA